MVLRMAGIPVGVKVQDEKVEQYLTTTFPQYVLPEFTPVCFTVRATALQMKQYDEVWSKTMPSWQLELDAIYHQIALKMLEYNAFYMHASVVEVDGRAYAFVATPGTGKSTHTNLYLQHFGDRARIVNGDKPLIRLLGKTYYACGHPWCGKEHQNTDCMTPLKAICFLERGEKNTIRRATVEETVASLFNAVITPQDLGKCQKAMQLLDGLVKALPFYVLQCNISDEAVNVSYEAMSKG